MVPTLGQIKPALFLVNLFLVNRGNKFDNLLLKKYLNPFNTQQSQSKKDWDDNAVAKTAFKSMEIGLPKKRCS